MEDPATAAAVKWSDAEVMRLLDGYQTNKDEFLDSKKKKRAIWQIAEKFYFEFGSAKTGEQAYTKYMYLKKGTLIQMTIGVKLG